MFDLPFGRAAVIGAILIVSGPTVVGPLLAVIRPKQPLESVLAFEGIFIDPIGATVALAMVHLALHEQRAGPRRRTALVGHPHRAGVTAAVYLAVIVRFGRVPAGHPRRARRRASRSTAFAIAESVVRGVRPLGDDGPRRRPGQPAVGAASRRCTSSAATSAMLLIGSLFIVLSARVDLDALVLYAPATLVLVAFLRARSCGRWRPGSPRSRTVLSRRERAMVGWMAPRGIVAASTASVFALQFEDAGEPFPAARARSSSASCCPPRSSTGAQVRWSQRLLGVRSDEPEPIDDDGVPREISDRS